MSQVSAKLIAALAELAEANHRLQVVLQENEQFITDGIAYLEQNIPVSVILEQIPVMTGQGNSDEAFSKLFAARQQMRRVLVGAALDEGIAVESLAALLGVRPDLVQSYAAEQLRQE